MPKTIEERFEEFLDAIDEAPYLARMPFFEPIIADWNAAAEAMKILVQDILDLRLGPDYWYCPICRGSVEFHPERHTPDKCSVAAAQAMIALMEGDLPAGENVVQSG